MFRVSTFGFSLAETRRQFRFTIRIAPSRPAPGQAYLNLSDCVASKPVSFARIKNLKLALTGTGSESVIGETERKRRVLGGSPEASGAGDGRQYF